jgi:hypothetical protein
MAISLVNAKPKRHFLWKDRQWDKHTSGHGGFLNRFVNAIELWASLPRACNAFNLHISHNLHCNFQHNQCCDYQTTAHPLELSIVYFASKLGRYA